MKRSKAWEHVKPTTYLTRERYKQLKRDALLLPPEKRPIISRNVTPHPKMQRYITAMQTGETNYRTFTAVGSKKKFGRVAGTTKKSISKRGVPVRVIYNVILKKEVKEATIKYIQTAIKNANFTDTNKAKEIEERLIKKAMKAKPNTTLVLNRKRKLSITFTDDMFKRNIAY